MLYVCERGRVILMGATKKYQKRIWDFELMESHVVTAYSEEELEAQVKQQREHWEAEKQRRKADNLTACEEKRIEDLRRFLLRSYEKDKPAIQEVKEGKKLYPPFAFGKEEPVPETYLKMYKVPRYWSLPERLFPGLTERRRERHELAMEHYGRDFEAFVVEKEQAWEAYVKQKEAFERGEGEAIVNVVNEVLSALEAPENFIQEYDTTLDIQNQTAKILLRVPDMQELKWYQGYVYVADQKRIVPVPFRPEAHKELYEELLCQVVLLVAHRIFLYVMSPHVNVLQVRGYVRSIDPATGRPVDTYVIMLDITRDVLATINLELVQPRACVRRLDGGFGENTGQVMSKAMVLNRASIALTPTGMSGRSPEKPLINLATIDWREFEHLVGELFRKIFRGHGVTISVTQASRDGGVDIVVKDPDPLRGGKFVVQVKRYTNMVPIETVRALYGTMLKEKATKGFLVATSRFSDNSRDFVRDLPITLIDGPALLAYFKQYGYENVVLDRL